MRTLVLVAGLLLAFPVAAQAESFLINNGLAPPAPSNVIDDARYLDGQAYVRNVGCGTPYISSPCPAPGAPTEVELVDGGDLFALRSFDSSAITVSGGHVFAAVGHGTSSVTIDGGNPENVDGLESSTVTINGDGSHLFTVRALDSSTIIINGGWMSVGASFSSTVTVNGGVVELIQCDGDGNTITVRGGTVWTLRPWAPCATVTVSGGTVNYLEPISHSTVTIVGGSVLQAEPGIDSTILVIGRGFAVDGSPVPYGDLAADSGTLTGRLASGDLLDMGFDLGTGPSRGIIRLVDARPIPALSLSGKLLLAAALLGIGVLHRRRVR